MGQIAYLYVILGAYLRLFLPINYLSPLKSPEQNSVNSSKPRKSSGTNTGKTVEKAPPPKAVTTGRFITTPRWLSVQKRSIRDEWSTVGRLTTKVGVQIIWWRPFIARSRFSPKIYRLKKTQKPPNW